MVVVVVVVVVVVGVVCSTHACSRSLERLREVYEIRMGCGVSGLREVQGEGFRVLGLGLRTSQAEGSVH